MFEVTNTKPCRVTLIKGRESNPAEVQPIMEAALAKAALLHKSGDIFYEYRDGTGERGIYFLVFDFPELPPSSHKIPAVAACSIAVDGIADYMAEKLDGRIQARVYLQARSSGDSSTRCLELS